MLWCFKMLFLLCVLERLVFTDSKTPALLCWRSFGQQAVLACGWPASPVAFLGFSSRAFWGCSTPSPCNPFKSSTVSEVPPRLCSHLCYPFNVCCGRAPCLQFVGVPRRRTNPAIPVCGFQFCPCLHLLLPLSK